MNKSSLFAITAVILLASVMLEVVSAQTFIVGKTYNSDFSSEISGASVTVSCSGVSFDTISKSDGTYGVVFEEYQCNQTGTVVSLSATKGTFSGSASGSLIIDSNSSYAYISIINILMSEPPPNNGNGGSSGGGGSSSDDDDDKPNKFFLCGNDVCDSGETMNTCSQDCSSFIPLSTDLEDDKNKPLNLEMDKLNQDKKGIAGITGAVIGTLGTGGTILAAVFVIGIIGTTIVFYSARKNKIARDKKTESAIDEEENKTEE